MSGFGTAPFGTGPYGFGAVVEPTDTTGSLFLSSDTGKTTGSRKIDQRTGDYTMGATGRLEGMGDSAQLVQIAIASLKLAGGRLTPATEGIVRRKVEAALEHVIGPGRIELQELVFDKFKSEGLFTAIRWRDLVTEQEGEAEFG